MFGFFSVDCMNVKKELKNTRSRRGWTVNTVNCLTKLMSAM